MTFSIVLLFSKNFLTSETAILVARSNGNLYTPVLIAGNAIVFTLFFTASSSEFM